MPIISSGDVTVEGKLTAEEYVVSSSVTNQTIAQASSSTEFGDDSADTHVFTGSLFITGGLNLLQDNSPTNPTLNFGDGNTGFYESSDNVIRVAIAGAHSYGIDSAAFQGNASNRFAIRLDTPTSTVPNFTPNKTDSNTGIGWSSADKLSLIAGGVSGAEITSTGVSGSSTSTGSFGHLEIGGSPGAFGKRFEVHGNGSITSAATGDQEIKFGSNRPDNLTMTMNSGGDTTLTMTETEKGILTLSKTLVSGSAASTGSFGMVHAATKLGLGTQSPGAELEIKATARDAELFVIERFNDSQNFLEFKDVSNDPSLEIFKGDGQTFFKINETGDIFSNIANAKISGSSTSTGSFGQLRSGPQIITNNLANNVGLIVDNNTETNAIQTDAKWGPEFSQTTSDGTGLTVVRNNNDTETYPLVRFTSEHATTTQPTLTIKQDGAGYGLEIDQNGNANAIRIDGSATNNVAGIQAHCDSLTTGRIAYFYSNSSDTSTRGLVKIVNDHASATGATALEIQQDSTGTGIEITADMAISASALSTSSFGYVKGTMFSGSFQGQIGGRSTHFQTTAATQWVMTHNLGTQFVNVTVYDDNNEMIIPTTVTATSTTVMTLDFDSAVAGTAMIGLGGLSNDQGRAFIFTQDTAGTNWQITHSLGEQYPVVTFYDEQDRVILPSIIEATDHNHMDVAFEQSTSGKAMVTVGNGIPGVNANNAGNYMRVSSDGQNIVFTESVSEVTGSFDISGSITVTGEGTISSSVSSTGSFGSVVTDRNISIGTSTFGGVQAAKLYISEDDSSFGNTTLHIENAKADDAAVLVLEGARTSTNDTGQLIFANSGDTVARIAGFSGHGSNNDSGEIQFSISADGTASSITTAMTIDTTGFVGIGISSPDTTLHIQTSDASLGTADANASLIVEENDHTYIELLTPNDKQSGIIFSDGAIGGLINYNHSDNSIIFQTAAATFLTADSSQNVTFGANVGIGSSTIATSGGDTPQLQTHKTNNSNGLGVFQWGNNAAHSAMIKLAHSKSGTIGNHTILADNDAIGTIQFNGSDGTNFDTLGASIHVEVDGTPAANRIPGAMIFSTSAVSDDGNTERIRITSAGFIGIAQTSPDSPIHITKENAGYQGIFDNDNGAAKGVKIRIKSNDAGDRDILTLQEGASSNTVLSVTKNHLISGSSTSTGSFGKVFVGAGSIQTQQNQVGHYPGLLQIESDIEYGAVMTMVQNSNDAAPSLISLGKTRGTAPGSNTIVQANDLVGRLVFSSADGTDLRSNTAEIRAKVTGLPQADSIPGELIFMTAGSGSADSIQRMVINSSGSVGIGDTNPTAASLSVKNATGAISGIKIEQDQGYYGLEIDQDGNNAALYIDSEATTNSSIYIPQPTNTAGSVLMVDGANSLTTGRIAYFGSNSSDTGTRNLVEIVNDHASATGATALKIQQDSTANSLLIDHNGATGLALYVDAETTTGTAVEINTNVLTTGVGTLFTANSSNTGAFDIVRMHNNHASATGATVLKILQDSTGTGIEVEGSGMAISGSATSTGSFGMGNFADKLGISTTSPTAKLHTHFNASSTSPQVVFGSGSLGTSGSRYPTTDGTKMSPVHFTGYQEVQTGTGIIVAEVPYVSGIADSRLSGTLEVNYTAEEDSNRSGYYLFRIHYTGNTNITTVTTSTTNSSMAAVKVVADDSMGIKITPTTTGTQNVLVYYEFKGFLGTS